MSWHKNTFSYRLPIEVNSDHVDQDVSNFVLSFKLIGDHHLFDHTRSDGYDIIVTDFNGNDLYFERSVWSQSEKKLILYLKLDVSSSYNTKFYIYYELYDDIHYEEGMSFFGKSLNVEDVCDEYADFLIVETYFHLNFMSWSNAVYIGDNKYVGKAYTHYNIEKLDFVKDKLSFIESNINNVKI